MQWSTVKIDLRAHLQEEKTMCKRERERERERGKCFIHIHTHSLHLHWNTYKMTYKAGTQGEAHKKNSIAFMSKMDPMITRRSAKIHSTGPLGRIITVLITDAVWSLIKSPWVLYPFLLFSLFPSFPNCLTLWAQLEGEQKYQTRA